MPTNELTPLIAWQQFRPEFNAYQYVAVWNGREVQELQGDGFNGRTTVRNFVIRCLHKFENSGIPTNTPVRIDPNGIDLIETTVAKLQEERDAGKTD